MTKIEIIKNLIFPIIVGFFSSLMGGLIAIYIHRNTQKIEIEKNNLKVFNNTLLEIDRAISEVVAIKKVFLKKVNSDPFVRLIQVPIIPVFEEISIKIVDLSFIPFMKSKGKKSRWEDLPEIRAVFSRYNSLISILQERNQLVRKYNALLQEELCESNTDERIIKIITSIGKTELLNYIYITENLFTHLDSVQNDLIELMSFLSNNGENIIKPRLIRKYGHIYSLKMRADKKLDILLKSIPKADFNRLSVILNENIDEYLSRSDY